MMRRAIIFDFFGVICSEVAPFWLLRYFSDVEAAALKQGLIHEADLGRISQEMLFQKLGEMAGISSLQVDREWRSLVEMNVPLLSALRELRNQTSRLGLLTNSPSPFFRNIIENHQLEGLFDKILVSSEVGIAKPDPRIFQMMLMDLDIGARDAVMIDDNPENIAGACAVGMHGLIFRTNNQIIKDLDM
ncbi:MAG: HAD family hydrolase [Alphaproteobacteria bacterium]